MFGEETDVERADPNFDLLKKLDLRGVAIKSQSDRWDFVVRFFAPNYGIPQDPLTGSAYTQIAPYWAVKLGKNRFRVQQRNPFTFNPSFGEKKSSIGRV